MRKFYFSIYELTVLSLLGALTAVLQVSLRLPLGIPGHTGIYLVIPLIIGVAVVGKFGAGSYMGTIFGLISAFVGAPNDTGLTIFLHYLAMGVTIDLLSIPFKGHFDNVLVGIIVGSVSNFSKLSITYVIDTLLGLPMGFIVLGLGVACVFHLVFGAIGGVIAALVLDRLYKSGVIRKNELPAD